MDKTFDTLVKELKKAGIDDPEDLDRSMAYAHDLVQGLRAIRTYAQGVTIFGSARVSEKDKYYNSARELGRLLANNGHAVITGGGPGIMEAANRGAYEYGGRSIGLNISLPHEQHSNPYLTDELEFKYFFARKVMLTMSSKAFICFPGGFGTLDEISEILCLVQEGKMPQVPIFFFGKSYWKPLTKFFESRMLKQKFIKPVDLKLFKLTDDIAEIVRAANHAGHPRIGDNFYDNFHKTKNMI